MEKSRITKREDGEGNEIHCLTVSAQTIESFENLMQDTKFASSTYFAIVDRGIMEPSLKGVYFLVLRQKNTYQEKGYHPIDVLTRALINFDPSLTDEKENIEKIIESYENTSDGYFINLVIDKFIENTRTYFSLDFASRCVLPVARDKDTFEDIFELVKKEFEGTAVARALGLSLEMYNFSDAFGVVGQPTISYNGQTDEYYGNSLMINEFGLECIDTMPISSSGNEAYLEEMYED